MSRFPGIEAGILRALELEEEVRPPEARLAQEFFWQAASALQSQGLCVADQAAGVVRRPSHGTLEEERGERGRELLREAEEFLALSVPARVSSTDLRGRLRLLVRDWTTRGARQSIYRQCAIDLEEVLEETEGKQLKEDEMDDREEFERDRRHLSARYLRERIRRFSSAMERLEAEAAALDPVGAKLAEQVLRIGNLTAEPVQYRVVTVDASPVDELEAALAAEEGGLFGERMRAALDDSDKEIDFRLDPDEKRALLQIAAEIDRDEKTQRDILRRQVEEAVERLRYSVATWQEAEAGDLAITGQRRDILDAEPFLAELDRIFGDRPEREDANAVR